MFDVRSSMCDVRLWTKWLVICLIVFVTSDIALGPSNMAYAQSDAEHQQFLFAYKLLQRKENNEAAAAFDEYLGKFPKGEKLGDAQYYRAMLYRKAKKNDAAAKLLDNASEPTIVPAYAVKLLQGQVYNDQTQYKKSLAALEQIQIDKVAPGVAFAAHLMKAAAYRGTGNLKAAESALLEAVKLPTPNKPNAYLTLANTQMQMKEGAKALKTLDTLLALADPATMPVAARLAGDLSYNAGQYEKAIGYYNTVVTRFEATEHFTPCLVGLMWAQFGDQKYEALLKTYAQATRVLPIKDRFAAAYLAGSAHQELGHHDKAVGAFRGVSESQGPASLREKATYKLAVSLYELKQYDQMNAAVKVLGEKFPQSKLLIDAAFLQASAEAESGKVEQGVARLTEFIAKGPDQAGYYGQALLRRAHLYETNRKFDAAIADYDAYLDTIKQTSPTSIQASFRLMELLSATGKHARVEKLAKALLLSQESSLIKPAIEQEAMYRLAVAYRFQGDLDKAMATHEQLMKAHPINPYAAESVYEQGLIRMTRGQAEQGVKQLLQAADLESLALSSRISALRVVAQHAVDTGDTATALKLRLKMQQLGGVDVFSDDERLWLGETLIGSGESGRAMGYLTAIKGQAPQDRAKLLIGQAHRELGEMDKAIAVLNEVRAVSERYNLDAWLEIAKVYRDQGKLDLALRELTALQNPDRGQRIASQALYEGGLINKQRAMNRLKLKDQAGAQPYIKASRDALKKLWLLYPDRAGETLAKFGYLHLAALHHAAGDAQSEIQTLSELIEAEPDTPHATPAKAVLSERAGKPERADAYVRQLRQQTQGDAAFSQLLDSFIRRGD